MVFTSTYNYNDKATQDKILDFLKLVEGHQFVADNLYTEFWLKSYLSFMERNGEYLGLNNTDELTFIQNLREVRRFIPIRTKILIFLLLKYSSKI